MKKKFVRMYRWFREIRRLLLWYIDTYVERLKIKNKNVDHINILKGAKIILIPHSDDEWIGCSSIVQSKGDVLLCNADMRGNDDVSTHEARYHELVQLANKNDHVLLTLQNRKAEKLANIIVEFKANYIFVPYAVDWHEEHIETMKILADAMQIIGDYSFAVVMYQVSVPIIPQLVNCATAMGRKEWKNKWNFCRSHYKTQKNIPFRRFALHERINGKIVNAYAAEVFCVLDREQWRRFLDRNILGSKEREEFKQNLQSIKKIRKLAMNKIVLGDTKFLYK